MQWNYNNENNWNYITLYTEPLGVAGTVQATPSTTSTEQNAWIHSWFVWIYVVLLWHAVCSMPNERDTPARHTWSLYLFRLIARDRHVAKIKCVTCCSSSKFYELWLNWNWHIVCGWWVCVCVSMYPLLRKIVKNGQTKTKTFDRSRLNQIDSTE